MNILGRPTDVLFFNIVDQLLICVFISFATDEVREETKFDQK